jgi:hypothetical protein
LNLVSRIAGAARLLATGKLAQSTGFEGAQMQRRLVAWRAGSESINRLILQGGELQRARARQLVRTNPYAANAAASFTAHAVGCGIKPSSLVEDDALKDQIQRLWLAWADEADADGLTDFYGLQAMAARAMFEAGECFLRFRPQRPHDELTVPLQLQMLSSEHLPLSKCETLPNGNEIVFGIELDRIGRRVTVWIDGIAASIASVIAMAGDEVVMPENAMLMLHDPSGLVMGTASDMRAMAEALDRMKADMIAAYRDKSGRDDTEIEALLRDETWLSAREAVDLGLADRVEAPVKMAAHFDLSRFRNTPPQLAAILTSSTSQEDLMSDPQKTRGRKPDPDPPATAQALSSGADDNAGDTDASSASRPAPVADAEPGSTPAVASQPAVAEAARPAESPPQTSAQVIDIDAVRADERKGTLAYVAEVHEALRSRGPRRSRCRLHRQGDAACPCPPRAA